jgi:hypothetical protein
VYFSEASIHFSKLVSVRVSPRRLPALPKILTTKETAAYLKIHEIITRKADEGETGILK